MFLLKFRHESKLWNDLEAHLSLSPSNTHNAINITIKDFLTFFKKPLNTLAAADFLSQCTGQQITEYLGDLKAKHKSAATIQNRGYLLKSVFNFIIKAGYRSDLPYFDVPKSKEQVRPTRRIEFEKIQKVLKEEMRKCTSESLMCACFLSCLFYGALRRTEALQLTLADVTEKDGRCILWLRHTKAQKSSEVVISKEGAWIILEWIKILRMNGYQNDDKLFSYNQTSAYRMFKSRFGCAPHAARAAGITAALSNGAPLDEVQEFARLSSFGLVKVYDKRTKSLANSPGALLSFNKSK